MSEHHDNRPITNRELNERLEKIPTRWEMFFYISGALLVNQVIPSISLAKTAAVTAIGVIS